jgi:hypothetical protein
MSARRPRGESREASRPSRPESDLRPPDDRLPPPPAPRRALLTISGGLLAAWIAFLAWLAVTS